MKTDRMNNIKNYDELVELFEREPEIHLDIEISLEGRIGRARFQKFRLHNGKNDENWKEFYSGELETTLEEHHGETIYADEIAGALLGIGNHDLARDLASVTEFENLSAGIKH